MHVVLVCVACLIVVCATQGTSSVLLEAVDLDLVFQNERLVQNIFGCFMDRGRCSPLLVPMKKNIPDALASDCSKCTAKQKEKVDTVMTHLYHKKPDMFKQLEQKYDPQGIYRKRHLEVPKQESTTKKSKEDDSPKVSEKSKEVGASSQEVTTTRAEDTSKGGEVPKETEKSKIPVVPTETDKTKNIHESKLRDLPVEDETPNSIDEEASKEVKVSKEEDTKGKSPSNETQESKVENPSTEKELTRPTEGTPHQDEHTAKMGESVKVEDEAKEVVSV